MKFSRKHAGHYQSGDEISTLTEGDVTRYVGVRFVIRHMPEWTGPEKWAVTAATTDGIALVELSDCIARTFADAKRAAHVMKVKGWKRYTSPGFACWAVRS